MQRVGLLLSATKTANRNLENIYPHYSAEKRTFIIKQMWNNFGRTFAEFIKFADTPKENLKKISIIKGEENLSFLKERGGLVFGAHIANWEIVPKIINFCDKEVTIVYREANNPYIDKLIQNLRGNFKFAKKGPQGAKAMIKALKNKEVVIMLVDQKFNEGIAIELLGKKAMTAPAIATLAKKFSCPIIPLQVIRHENVKFEIIIDKPLKFNSGDSDEVIMVQINNYISNWVNAHPEQWFWMHKRWD